LQEKDHIANFLFREALYETVGDPKDLEMGGVPNTDEVLDDPNAKGLVRMKGRRPVHLARGHRKQAVRSVPGFAGPPMFISH
jgi:hypothetical protein